MTETVTGKPSEIVLVAFQDWLAAHRSPTVLTHVNIRVHSPQELFIHGFQVRPQGHGTGTKIMEMLQTLCRQQGVSILLEASAEDAFEPDADGEPTEEQARLEGWYLRLGFDYDDAAGDYGPIMRWTPE